VASRIGLNQRVALYDISVCRVVFVGWLVVLVICSFLLGVVLAIYSEIGSRLYLAGGKRMPAFRRGVGWGVLLGL